MSEPLMLAASLLGAEAVGMPPQPKPEEDLWKLVDQMSLLDQQRVEAYQRRSQPLAMQSRPAAPESLTYPRVTAASYETAVKLQPTPSKDTATLTAIAPNTFQEQQQLQTPTATPWRSPNPETTVRPASGSQLYSQRLTALEKGQLYTRLKSDSFQTEWSGATEQTTHEQWKKLLKQEASSVAKGQGSNRLGVLVGDSLSMWFPSEMLPTNKLWLNQGISGENSSQILQRLDALDPVNAETIYVMAGVNDLKQGATDATVLNNTRAIIRRLRYQHPNATIVLQSLLPTRHSYLSPQRATSLNQQLQAIATQEKAGYLNLHVLFTDQTGQLRTDLTTDGLHLNRKGYEVWQGAMQQAENWVATSKGV